MTIGLHARYRELRAQTEHLPASSALGLARYEAQPLPFDWEGGKASTQRDGFDVAIAIVRDEDAHAGAFSNDWQPGAVINPRSWDARHGCESSEYLRYYIPEFATVEDHRRGLAPYTSRHAADCLARTYVREELNRAAEPDAYGVVVTISRAGVELAEASLWGIESDMLLHYVSLDVVPDLIADALPEAREAIKKVCAA